MRLDTNGTQTCILLAVRRQRVHASGCGFGRGGGFLPATLPRLVNLEGRWWLGGGSKHSVLPHATEQLKEENKGQNKGKNNHRNG